MILSSKERWLAKGAGSLVDTLTSLSLKLSGSEASISSSDQYDLICSYNWANMRQPTVYVPGKIVMRSCRLLDSTFADVAT